MSKSEPYRETSNVPVYFEPRIENISWDEYKASRDAVASWRGFQITAIVGTLILSFVSAYYIQTNHDYWLAVPFLSSIAIAIFAGHHAKFHRNICLEYLRRNKT